MSTTEVVVWEWEDSNKWQPYEPKVSNGIEKAFQPFFAKSQQTQGPSSFIRKIFSQDVVSLKQFKPELSFYEVNFSSMLQKNTRTKRNRCVRRQTYALDSPISRGIVWGYQSATGSVVYCNDVGAILEDAYMQNNKMVHLGMTPFNVPFTVYIEKMIQTNNFSGEEHTVLRDVMPDKYTTERVPVNSAKAPSNRKAKASSSFSSPLTRNKPATRASSSATGPKPGHPQRVASRHPGGSSNYGQQSNQLNPAAQPFYMPSLTSNSVTSRRFTGPSGTSNLGIGHSFPMSNTIASYSSSLPNQSTTIQPSSNLGSAHSFPMSNATASPSWSSPSRSSTMQPASSYHTKKSGSVTNDRGFSGAARHSSAIDVVRQFANVCAVSEGECPICCDVLTSASGFCEDKGATGGFPSVMQLKKCKHAYHTDCIVAMYNNSAKNGCLQCPTCKTIYGMKTGICPRGRMYYESKSFPLPGHPDCGTIEITYSVNPGSQGPEHPNPGAPYRTQGFPRKGYLPDNREGKRVLRLLIEAFERRLTFTIGTSVTTGLNDTVVWNEIHHKSTIDNSSGHGYPDEKYLENVTAELAAQGVTLVDEEGI